MSSLHLVALEADTSIATFTARLPSSPILVARVVRWIVPPWTEAGPVEPLASTAWDVVVLYPSVAELPELGVRARYSLTVGIPSGILRGFDGRNARLLRDAATAPRLASESRGTTDELRAWADGVPDTPVSMLNFLAVREGMQDSYRAYGRAFAEDVGRRHGGVVKVVGRVLGAEREGGRWDQIAVAGYPSPGHFVEMVGDGVYQAVNERYRVPALRGTGILCCEEVGVEGEANGRAKM